MYSVVNSNNRYIFFFFLKDYKGFEKVLIKSHGKLMLSPEVHDDDQSDNAHSVVTLAYSNVVVQAEKKLPVIS